MGSPLPMLGRTYTHCLRALILGAELKTNRAASTIPREAVIVDDNNLEYVHYSEWDPKVHVSAAPLRLKPIVLNTRSTLELWRPPVSLQ
jgi:hypothetical protein